MNTIVITIIHGTYVDALIKSKNVGFFPNSVDTEVFPKSKITLSSPVATANGDTF